MDIKIKVLFNYYIMKTNYSFEIEGMDLGKIKLDRLFRSKTSMYYAFLDESIIQKNNCVLSVLVLTNNTNKLRKVMDSLSKKAVKMGIIKTDGFLHFTRLLKDNYLDFLVTSLKEIKKCDFLVFLNIIHKNEVDEKCSVVSGKIIHFIRIFSDMHDHEIWNKNMTLIFDKSFIPKRKQVDKYYLILTDHEENKKHSYGGYIIPSNDKFRNKIKDKIGKCYSYKEFPVDVQSSYVDRGLQAADFITGATVQMIKGNKKFLNIIKNKFYDEGKKFKFDHISLEFSI